MQNHRHLSQTMDEFARQAVRPWQTGFASEAPAILFIDQAELLACFARDWLSGELTGRWWWRALFPTGAWPVILQRAWTENPRHIPAALDLLDQRQSCAAFLRRLAEPFITHLSTQVVRTYSVEQPFAAISAILKPEQMDKAKEPQSRLNSPQKSVLELHQQRPWEHCVAPDNSLNPEVERLRVLCLLLVRAPALVRSLHLLDVARPSAHLDQNPTHASHSVLSSSPGRPKVSRSKTRRQRTKKSFVPIDTIKANLTARNIPGFRQPAHISLPDFHTSEDRAVAPQETSTTSQPLKSGAEDERIARRTWQTRYGGVFYLINVAVALALYSDFTRPRSPSLPLPIWDFLALIGKKFLGAELQADPLWHALAHLAARSPNEPPGVYFQPPAVWRTPLAWIEVFPQKEGWRGAIQNGFLKLEHPAGFTALERTLTGDDNPATTLEDECARFGISANDLLPETLARAPDESPLDRWQNLLTGYLDARLTLTFRKFNLEFVEPLFLNDAAIIVDTENVVVRFALDKHPIAVRMAGLDRDPGWIPAAARVVRFEYE